MHRGETAHIAQMIIIMFLFKQIVNTFLYKHISKFGNPCLESKRTAASLKWIEQNSIELQIKFTKLIIQNKVKFKINHCTILVFHFVKSTNYFIFEEKKKLSPTSLIFAFVAVNSARYIEINKTGGYKARQKWGEIQKASWGGLKTNTACQRTNPVEVVFYSLQQIEAAEWDGATICPQLRAMHWKSTKINGNNSTLDTHHYPDGVLGELQAT